MHGTVRVSEHGALKLHTYVGPVDSFLVSSHIVESPNALVIFDAQYALPDAREVAGYAEGIGKPVERIVVSHVHPDHWFGLEALTERFPDAGTYALAAVRDYIAHNGERIRARNRDARGDAIPSTLTIPEHVLPEGSASIDGVAFEFEEVVEAESEVQLVARLPEQRILLAFDLVYPAQYHVFTVEPHFAHWLEVLDSLECDVAYEQLLVGHGGSTTRSAIAATASYLRDAKEIYETAAGPEDFAERLKSAHPEREQPGWVDFSALLLYRAL